MLAYLLTPLVYLLSRLDLSQIGATLGTPETRAAIRVSLLTASCATVFMTVFGVPLGYLLSRSFPGRNFLMGLIFVPMVLPPLVGGILLLLLWGPYGLLGRMCEGHGLHLVNDLAGIVLAQVFVSAPLVIISAASAFGAIDRRLELAAATLGDSGWRTFWRISLPLAWPGVAAGIVLGWVRSLGEFGATLVMAYHPNSIPVYLYVQLTSSGVDDALPLALLLIVLSLLATGIVRLFGRLPA
jgi:molybdate/tungstate transport system permease protein